MSEFVQIGAAAKVPAVACAAPARSATVLWLQGITLLWMLVECGVSLYAAHSAHSAALLAFGSDSLVELFSAAVVALQYVPGIRLSERLASRTAGALLFALAIVVAATGIATMVFRVHPEISRGGIAITVAALIAMPVLAALKRREARRNGNAALAADAVQSAMCAYLACITLAGLVANAVFHRAWLDPVAALIAVPLLIKEGRAAWRGQGCACC